MPLATAHGWTGHTWRERFYYSADKRLLARFPRVVAVSSEIRRTLVRAGAAAERVSVVLNGIDPERFVRDPARPAAERLARGFAPADQLIGAVGRLEPQKRFDLLIEAVVELRRRRPAVRLLIAGDGSLRPSLQALADRAAPGAILVLGHVDDVIGFHHLLDVLRAIVRLRGHAKLGARSDGARDADCRHRCRWDDEISCDGVHGLVVPIRRRGQAGSCD